MSTVGDCPGPYAMYVISFHALVDPCKTRKSIRTADGKRMCKGDTNIFYGLQPIYVGDYILEK
jgi:hypothetical protein